MGAWRHAPSGAAAVNVAVTATGSAAAQLDGYHAGFAVPLAAALIATVTSVFGLRRRAPHAR